MSVKILFTCVGRRVELVQAFKNAGEKLGTEVIIYGTDCSDDAAALFFCDEKIRVKRIDDSNYISDLLKLCVDNNIDMVIPTIDTDLMKLAMSKKKFEDIGTKVLISDVDKIKICRDKRYIMEFFYKCGLKSPKVCDDIKKFNIGFPCFIKPKDGSSSINAYKVDCIEDLMVYVTQIKDYIIQPYIEGKEYTVDILCDYNGNPIYITPRERKEVRGGEVLKTLIVDDKKIVDECKRIVKEFKPCGPITVQLIKQHETNENYYIEINPRFGGGAPLSMKAGAESASAVIDMINGKEISYCERAAEQGKIYSRFDQSVCVNSKEIQVVKSIVDIGKYCENYEGVVFDLDDTLYSELDYVKSGLKKVAEKIYIKYYKSIVDKYGNITVDDLYNKLIDKFEVGKNILDELLIDIGIYADEVKEDIVRIYREHIPNIKLYKGVVEIITQLKNDGKIIGIITDGRPDGQKKKIEVLGLDELVDEIIITDELGGVQFRKPDKNAFYIMKRRMMCEFKKMVYIGDNINKDFVAPNKLGMGSIWVKNELGLYYK